MFKRNDIILVGPRDSLQSRLSSVFSTMGYEKCVKFPTVTVAPSSDSSSNRRPCGIERVGKSWMLPLDGAKVRV